MENELNSAHGYTEGSEMPYYPIWLQDFDTPSVLEYKRKMREYNPVCRCGHLHNEHNEAAKTANVSAGKCTKCNCEYFVIAKVSGSVPEKSDNDDMWPTYDELHSEIVRQMMDEGKTLYVTDVNQRANEAVKIQAWLKERLTSSPNQQQHEQ